MTVKLVKKATPAAIAVLRQATALKPRRMKASDGLLPSAAHQIQNPNSDHNSGYAVDITHDPKFGIDGAEVFNKLRTDKRVSYLIFNGKIWSADKGERVYTGPNKHNHHCHISIKAGFGDDTSPWFPWLGAPTVINKVKANLPKPLPKKEVK
jgi:hypothetical protein